MSRARLEEVQNELETARLRLAALRQERGELPYARPNAPKRQAALAVFLAIASLGAFGYAISIRPPTMALPAERVAHRDALRQSYEQESQAVRATAEPDAGRAATALRPEAYPALRDVRRELGDAQEGVLAWAQIGLAACTVKEPELGRQALTKLRWAAEESTRARDGGSMHPGISLALRNVDEACRQQGIHLLVPGER